MTGTRPPRNFKADHKTGRTASSADAKVRGPFKPKPKKPVGKPVEKPAGFEARQAAAETLW
ncbi:MAG: hypothetical protein WBY12_08455, partial [Hyphomicrobium sp.]